jgi:hypothetical protein
MNSDKHPQFYFLPCVHGFIKYHCKYVRLTASVV